MKASDCPRCKQVFGCLSTDIQNCQCASIRITDRLQNLLKSNYTDCLCKRCLVELSVLEQRTENSTRPTPGMPLQEGFHFYYENGLMVFTAEYHYLRGNCCGSGCRNCVYAVHRNDEQ